MVTQFVSFKSPEDIFGSRRKLDQLLKKGSGPQSFQLACGQCFCFFSPIASWTRLDNLLVSARMFPDSVIFWCQAALQNAVAEQSNPSSESSCENQRIIWGVEP
ncbi:hypothetical protein RHGRI_038488 [Rhododendron griersonianum]|uniref:Uncharacterized protein n=1 Tax=Rhododendron griersonianum TaxID=479676 RepID=A0AAV6HPM1_9ERIC|nr:hypothetical protein RHGRI_038488 [Rhododendron griersonianum]